MKNSLTRRNFLKKSTTGLAGVAALSAAAGTSLYGDIFKNTGKPAILGGTPVRTKSMSTVWPLYDAGDVRLLLDAFYSNRWCSLGSPRCNEFEEKWAKLMDVPYCLTTASGTSALFTSLMALGVGPGDEVIVTPFTYSASYEVIFMLHALGVFVDTDPETYKINADLIEERINEHTKAILPVHIGGGACDMDKIMAISKKYNIPVIEDTCQGWLGEWKGKKLGTIGNSGCYSFNYYKNICSGEGGAIISSNSEFMDLCDSIVNDGRFTRINRSSTQDFSKRRGDEKQYPGFNFRLTEIQAGILLGQILRIEEQQRIRNENFDYLDKLLDEIPGISAVKKYPGQTYNGCYTYHMIYDKKHFNGLHKSQFAKAVGAEGIGIGAGGSKGNLTPQIEYHLNSREFKSVFSKKRLDKYRKENHCPVNNHIAEEASLSIGHRAFLGPKKDMEDIAEAAAKIQRNSADLVGKI